MTGEGKFFDTLGTSLVTELPGAVKIKGDEVDATTAGTSAVINALIYDVHGMILLATGTDVPANATAGYAKGCLYIDTNVAAGTTGLYVNVGTVAEANFDAVSDA